MLVHCTHFANGVTVNNDNLYAFQLELGACDDSLCVPFTVMHPQSIVQMGR